MKWHLVHREQLPSWDEYLDAIKSAFPLLVTTSPEMNLKMLRDLTHADHEPFIDFYTSILTLCQTHVCNMPDHQIIDWLKAGMKIALYEKFTTPQALLLRAQRVELNDAVFDARRAECSIPAPVVKVSTSPRSTNYNSWDLPISSQRKSSSYPQPLLSIPTLPIQAPHVFNTPCFRNSPVSQSSNNNSSIQSRRGSFSRHRRPVICYSCNQQDHISPHCPYRPKD